ncbi:MAG: hypothetical protein L0Y56_02575, partial [Nitrospira sp.]|nr:hypothetical protein [Nitrospira sp.]
MNKKCLELLVLVILMQFPGLAFAQDGGDKKNVEVHGFLLGNFTGRTTEQGPEGSDFLLGEERVRVDISAWSEAIEASARVKGDLFHEAIIEEFDVDLREAYVDYTTGGFDFRLGRQIVTWGVGDLLFINDIFPKDWVSFFSGRPLEYLKLGVDGFRTRYSSKTVNVELLVIPFFEPDNLPTSERFFLFDPFAAVPSRNEEQPETTYENTELALRLYGKIGNLDVSAYAYKGFWRIPGIRLDDAAMPTQATIFYPKLSVYGLS